MKAELITVTVGVFIAVVSWVPLWIVEAYDRYAMPVGLDDGYAVVTHRGMTWWVDGERVR
jgi:hypothetical protein